MLVIDKGSVGPQRAADFLAGDQFAGPLQQQKKKLQRLGLEAHPNPLAAQFAGGRIRLKYTEPIASHWLSLRHVCRSV